jgi:dTDP-4-amino-4,6-dideoxy-D-glucose acyltransferase
MFGYYTGKELAKIGFGSIGRNVMISRAVELVNVSQIFIGSNSRIDTFAIIAPSGDATIRIGDHVHICAYTILNGLASINLEDFSSVGLHCSVLSSSENFDGEFLTNATIPKEFLKTISAPIMIRRHAIIATGSTILPGITIAEGTVVGAHSLVKESTEPFSIVGGVPAKRIKFRSNNLLEIEKKFLNSGQIQESDIV